MASLRPVSPCVSLNESMAALGGMRRKDEGGEKMRRRVEGGGRRRGREGGPHWLRDGPGSLEPKCANFSPSHGVPLHNTPF